MKSTLFSSPIANGICALRFSMTLWPSKTWGEVKVEMECLGFGHSDRIQEPKRKVSNFIYFFLLSWRWNFLDNESKQLALDVESISDIKQQNMLWKSNECLPSHFGKCMSVKGEEIGFIHTSFSICLRTVNGLQLPIKSTNGIRCSRI